MLTRYEPLIPLVPVILQSGAKARDALPDMIEGKKQTFGMDEQTLCLLKHFLHLYDCKKRSLKDLQMIFPALVLELSGKNIKSSLDCIRFCKGDTEEEKHLLALCHLMRLPGVKTTRAELYYACGYDSLRMIAMQNAPDMQAHIRNIVEETSRAESVPFLKELNTQIAVAKAFTWDD